MHPFHVNTVVAIASVFVFYLHHDDRTAVGDLVFLYDGGDLVYITFYCRCIPGVHTTDFYIRYGEQIRRKSAKVPFAADVRSRTE